MIGGSVAPRESGLDSRLRNATRTSAASCSLGEPTTTAVAGAARPAERTWSGKVHMSVSTAARTVSDRIFTPLPWAIRPQQTS